MKKLTFILFSCLLLATSACGKEPMRIKITVTDDDGKLVENAKVAMGFLLSKGSNSSKGYTNSEGEFAAWNVGQWGVSMNITKEGYYRSTLKVANKSGSHTVTLRQKKNPVPMYCRHILKPFVKKKQTVGFDLVAGDWLVPYGKGTTAHMEIYFDGRETDFWNYSGEMDIRFTNPSDGLLKLEYTVYESKFRFPYVVPNGDFINTLSQTLARTRDGTESTSEETYQADLLGYALRLNTEVDVDGNVITANYGSISGDIYFSPRTRDDGSLGRIKLTYCYNPVPNEKSLEVSENLAKSKQ